MSTDAKTSKLPLQTIADRLDCMSNLATERGDEAPILTPKQSDEIYHAMLDAQTALRSLATEQSNREITDADLEAEFDAQAFQSLNTDCEEWFKRGARFALKATTQALREPTPKPYHCVCEGEHPSHNARCMRANGVYSTDNFASHSANESRIEAAVLSEMARSGFTMDDLARSNARSITVAVMRALR